MVDPVGYVREGGGHVDFYEILLRREVRLQILESLFTDGRGLREFSCVGEDGSLTLVVDGGVAAGDGCGFLFGASGGLDQASSVALSVVALVCFGTGGEGEHLQLGLHASGAEYGGQEPVPCVEYLRAMTEDAVRVEEYPEVVLGGPVGFSDLRWSRIVANERYPRHCFLVSLSFSSALGRPDDLNVTLGPAQRSPRLYDAVTTLNFVPQGSCRPRMSPVLL